MTRQQTVNRTATESRKLEREIGFEPTASSLGNIRSKSVTAQWRRAKRRSRCRSIKSWISNSARRQQLLNRAMSYVELVPFSTCWWWTGALDPRGYGRFWLGGKSRKTAFAHRVLYEIVVGPIPRDLEPDHLCAHPGCVNPAHIEPVSHRENGLRARARVKPQEWCRFGHARTAQNTLVRDQGRLCLTCSRIVRLRMRRARRARQVLA